MLAETIRHLPATDVRTFEAERLMKRLTFQQRLFSDKTRNNCQLSSIFRIDLLMASRARYVLDTRQWELKY